VRGKDRSPPVFEQLERNPNQIRQASALCVRFHKFYKAANDRLAKVLVPTTDQEDWDVELFTLWEDIYTADPDGAIESMDEVVARLRKFNS
jgi:hypothetical protein